MSIRWEEIPVMLRSVEVDCQAMSQVKKIEKFLIAFQMFEISVNYV